VVSPSARRAMAKFAIDRGLSQRRSAWLCSTPRSGIGYRSKRWRRDRHLSTALRIVARADPSWGYRLAGAYLRLRGWKANDKWVYRLWRLNGLCLPPYRPRRKIRTGACTSSKHMAPLEPFSKRHFSARTFSSLAC
jgi:hypothetical protein